MRIKIGIITLLLMTLAVTAMAAKDHKPRRGRYYINPEERGKVIEMAIEEVFVKEEKSFIDKVKRDGRIAPWMKWWSSCIGSFGWEDLIDVGVMSIDDDGRPYDKNEVAGPNGKLMIRRGGKAINPVSGRMKYVKGKDGWEPVTGPRCGVVLYEKGKARTIVHCGELDGIFQGFWMGKDKAVFTAYRKTSPEMNMECKAKEVGTCVSPVLYLADLKNKTVWEYRGPVVTFAKCEPNDFLARCYPFFYIQPGEQMVK